MRRRLSWAAVGTSGVLAAIVATTMTNQSDSDRQRTKIIVPQAEELNGYIPSGDKTRPPTVFIPIVPPVAATSATSTVPPPPPPKAAPKPKPKPTTPAPPPPPVDTAPPQVAPQAPSYWDSYWYYYNRNTYRDRDGSGYRDGYGGGSYGDRDGGRRR